MARHAIEHVEIPTRDVDAASEYYRELFGWKTQRVPGYEYAEFEAEGGPGGGLTLVDDTHRGPSSVLIYVATDDINASLAQAEILGGTTITPKTEIPEIGWYGIFSDPSGNRIALFTGIDAQNGIRFGTDADA